MNRLVVVLLLTLTCIVVNNTVASDIVCLTASINDTTGFIRFSPGQKGFDSHTAFVSLTSEIPGIIPRLAVPGDFNGDGKSELALFMKVLYEPNMNPEYTCSDIMVFKADGNNLTPAGTWFSVIDAELDFNYVDHSAAGDFNLDGKEDIAIFYNDPGEEEQVIYVFESDGTGFSEPQAYYGTLRSEFNFTRIRFALPGDFNHNGLYDIAVFYDYNGEDPETSQSIFIFESGGTTFSLLPAFYTTTRQNLDFDYIKDASAADYDGDGFSDLVIFYSDPFATDHQLFFFAGEAASFSMPATWFSGDNIAIDPAGMKNMVYGHFDEDSHQDLALFYSHEVSGLQEVLLFTGGEGSFSNPEIAWSGTELSFDNITAVVSGIFQSSETIRPTTWKDNHRGAVSFTFDDGAYGAFAHGAACLDAAGLKGTFYIFTDTIQVYDAPLAGSPLIKSYRDKGFEIASHTMNHSNLGVLTGQGEIEYIRTLLQQSKEELDERFDLNTLTLSIPFGSFQYETLGLIAEVFHTARSSEYGYNLSTPSNFYALKSFPVLSTTSPSTVLYRVGVAEHFGYYLPLMYHDIKNEYFDPASFIYTYSLEDFSTTVDSVLERDVWVDTHENVYKYILERNGMEVTMISTSEELLTFSVDDGLPDSIFNVELTLQLTIPENWDDNCVTVEKDGELITLDLVYEGDYRYAYFNSLPDGSEVKVYKGVYTSIEDYQWEHDVNHSLKVYPNPVNNGPLRIEADVQEEGEVSLAVYDTRGILLRYINIGNRPSGRLDYVLDTSELAPGTYILQVYTRSGKPASALFLKL